MIFKPLETQTAELWENPNVKAGLEKNLNAGRR
jgi:hypothetical protein